MESPSILIAGGTYFDFIEPQSSKFTIYDIAHALANICRFGGHCKTFYSVAQHSVLVSYIVPKEFALAALLHDAPEAFIGDITRPLKALLPDYKEIERRVTKVVLNQFGLDEKLPDCVKHADMVMLATERRDLLTEHDEEWYCLRDVEPDVAIVEPWAPEDARQSFIGRYYALVPSIL